MATNISKSGNIVIVMEEPEEETKMDTKTAAEGTKNAKKEDKAPRNRMFMR